MISFVLMVLVILAAIWFINFIYEKSKSRKIKKPKPEDKDIRESWGEHYKRSYTNHK